MKTKQILSFNINDSVLVKLTDVGRQKLREQDEEFKSKTGLSCSSSVPSEDSEGWSRWQLWDLMNRLGSECYMGCQPAFDLTIRLAIEIEATATTV